MAKQTLTVQLMHANAEIAELRAKLSLAKREVEMFARTAHDAIARNDGIDPVTGAPKTIAPRKPLPAHFAAAREMAMRSGKCVRVAAA